MGELIRVLKVGIIVRYTQGNAAYERDVTLWQATRRVAKTYDSPGEKQKN